MRKINFLIIAVLALSLIGAIAGCGEATPTPTTTPTATPTATPVEPVKIGLLEDISGPYSLYGSSYNLGAKIAIQMVNDAGGIKSLGGAKITYAIGNGDSTVSTSTSEAERLINAEKVVAISGPTAAAEALALIPIIDRYKVPAISQVGSTEVFQKGCRYIFSGNINFKTRGEREADFIDWLVKEQGAPADNIAVCAITPGMSVEMGYLKNRLAELGYNNIVLDEEFPGSVTDQTPLVLKLKAADPDIVVYFGGVQDSISFFKACETLDYYPWLVQQDSGATPPFQNGIPPDIVKKVLTRPNYFNVGCLVVTDAHYKIPSLKAFFDAFKEADPESKLDLTSGALGAQKTLALLKAIENAASRNPEDIANALREIVIEAPDPYLVYAAQYPRFVMSDSGLPSSASVWASQYSDDLSVRQAIWPPELASAEPRIKK